MADSVKEAEGTISDDDGIGEDGEGPWFFMGMMRAEKVEVRRPWKT